MTRPPALTPINCDLRDFQFMPLYVASLRDSELASNETPEACWAAVLLWAASWHQVPAASIPNDDKWMAKAAGYGRVVKEWMRVRSGALRGFIECDDGRLYHPVVAEKAREAWHSKLEQRWRTECARIKKHNERHHTSLPRLSFVDWMNAGCPQGQPLLVPDEDESKRQGEGQGQGDSGSSEAIASAAADAPAAVDKSTKTPTPAAQPADPPPAEPSRKRKAWNACGAWLVAGGVAETTARELMGAVMRDYADVGLDALEAAPQGKDVGEPKAYLLATAKRLRAERGGSKHPTPTAAETAAMLARQSTPMSADEKAASDAARLRALAAHGLAPTEEGAC